MAAVHPVKFLDMLKTLRTERDMFRQIAEGFTFVWNSGTRYRAERDRANELLKNQAPSLPAPTKPITSLPESTQIESSKGTSKSTKLPDPELFHGTDRPSWEVWESNMCHKLLGNHDHFPTETLRISYIASRLSGIPAERALARLGPRALNPYKTAQDVFDHLSTIYGDPHRVIMAEAKFKALQQNTTPFREFYAEFDHLANLCGYIDQLMLKKELNYKLNNRLQTYIFQLPAMMDSFPTLVAAKEAIQARDDQERANAFVKASSSDPSNTKKERSAKGYLIPSRKKESQTTESAVPVLPLTKDKDNSAIDRKNKSFVPAKRSDRPVQIAEVDLEASQEDSNSDSSSDSGNE